MSTEDALLDLLTSLETELHRADVRRNETRTRELLHGHFVEIGRSGRSYSRDDILTELSDAQAAPPDIRADRFGLQVLEKNIALLTYRSAQVGKDGELRRFSLRSSVWMQTENGWQLRFHQGTPAEAGWS